MIITVRKSEPTAVLTMHKQHAKSLVSLFRYQPILSDGIYKDWLFVEVANKLEGNSQFE